MSGADRREPALRAAVAYRQPQPKRVMLSVRLDPEIHQELRRVAFTQNVSIHKLLLEGVDFIRAKYRSPD